MNRQTNFTKIGIQGHRGCRGLMPENTIQAFLKALDLGVETLELDVCISKDGQVVVSHEPYMNALFCTTPAGLAIKKSQEKNYNLYHMNYEEIKQFDSGSRGNRLFPKQQLLKTYKPLLSEVFSTCEAYCQKNNLPLVNYNIEIKSEEPEYGISQPVNVADFCDLVYHQIKQCITMDRIIIQSFDFNILRYFHTQNSHKYEVSPTLAALVTMEGVQPSFDKLGFLPAIFSPYYKQLTYGKVKKCHDKGVKVIPWTVNDAFSMMKMKNIGVDGLITDYPDIALSLTF